MSDSYLIRRLSSPIDFSAWDAPCWKNAETAHVALVRPESSSHHPDVSFRLLYDDSAIHGFFRVADRYVLSTHQIDNQSVCQDSCVEFFFQPFGKGPYFNLEMNCGGTVLCFYIADHTRNPNGFADYTILPVEELNAIRRFPSLPRLIDPEITEPTTWTLGFTLPYAMLEKYCGPISRAALSGSVWRANFYKCADKSSHPHWITWQPVSALNFHLPECFGNIRFE